MLNATMTAAVHIEAILHFLSPNTRHRTKPTIAVNKVKIIPKKTPLSFSLFFEFSKGLFLDGVAGLSFFVLLSLPEGVPQYEHGESSEIGEPQLGHSFIDFPLSWLILLQKAYLLNYDLKFISIVRKLLSFE